MRDIVGSEKCTMKEHDWSIGVEIRLLVCLLTAQPRNNHTDNILFAMPCGQ